MSPMVSPRIESLAAPASALFQQGTLLFQKGMVAQAEQAYRTLLAVDGRHVPCLFNLGTICARDGRMEEAVGFFRKALKRHPALAAAHTNLGNALKALGREREALRHYQTAARLEPQSAEAHNNLGIALKLAGRSDEAATHFVTALRLRPDFPEALGNFGNLLVELGRTDEAALKFEAAIGLAPRTGTYFRRLAGVRVFTPGDAYLARMEAAAADIDALPLDERIELHFALGKAYGDIRDYEASFRHMAAGNALQRMRMPPNEPELLDLLDRIEQTFTPEVMAARRGIGNPSAMPIFIVGMPRSGSTLIEQILASHEGVYGAGEIDDFAAEMARLSRPDGRAPFPEDILSLPDTSIRRLGTRYVGRIAALAPGAKRIVDKTLGNFHFLGLIHMALPEAKIVHARRDPVDTCFSCFAHLFADPHARRYALDEIGRHYRAYDRLMEHWRHVLPEGTMIEIRHEDLVADLEGQSRRLLARCGLDWDPACLDFHRTERVVRTSSAAQVRQPIFASSVGSSAPYRPWLGPLIDALEGR